jgi:hypothetical protein
MRAVRTRLLALAVCVLLLPGCTDKKKAPPISDPDAAGRDARARLSVLAQTTATGAYDATYDFVQVESRTRGQIRIRQVPPQYRIDVIGKDTASFFALRSRTVSCSQKAKKKTCFLVALPGEAVPPLFDPGVQRLFRDAVSDLAGHPNDYTVTRVPYPTPTGSVTATPSASTAPTGECFSVMRNDVEPTPGRQGFENGTYCFDEITGVATRIEVASGTLTLTRVGRDPDAAAFKPITKVVKLPDLSPTPTPKKKK